MLGGPPRPTRLIVGVDGALSKGGPRPSLSRRCSPLVGRWHLAGGGHPGTPGARFFSRRARILWFLGRRRCGAGLSPHVTYRRRQKGCRDADGCGARPEGSSLHGSHRRVSIGGAIAAESAGLECSRKCPRVVCCCRSCIGRVVVGKSGESREPATSSGREGVRERKTLEVRDWLAQLPTEAGRIAMGQTVLSRARTAPLRWKVLWIEEASNPSREPTGNRSRPKPGDSPGEVGFGAAVTEHQRYGLATAR